MHRGHMHMCEWPIRDSSQRVRGEFCSQSGKWWLRKHWMTSKLRHPQRFQYHETFEAQFIERREHGQIIEVITPKGRLVLGYK